MRLRRQWMELELEAAKAKFEERKKANEAWFAEFKAKYCNNKNLQLDHRLAPRRRPPAA